MNGEIVTAAFGEAIDGADVELFRKVIPTSIAQGVESCLNYCGIAKR